jgi:hypothetical protein
MTSVQKSGTFTLGDHTVYRLGYGTMQLAGPGVFGPPKDRGAAVAVLRPALPRALRIAKIYVEIPSRTGPRRSENRSQLHPGQFSKAAAPPSGRRQRAVTEPLRADVFSAFIAICLMRPPGHSPVYSLHTSISGVLSG